MPNVSLIDKLFKELWVFVGFFLVFEKMSQKLKYYCKISAIVNMFQAKDVKKKSGVCFLVITG